MKNSILILLFLIKAFMVGAQYNVAVVASTFPPGYNCTITTSLGSPEFTDQDLVTWIFPDGQFFQKKIEYDPALHQVLNNSNTLFWQPISNPPSGPDTVVVYLAKKGGTGNPPKKGSNTGITGPFSSTPNAFALPATETWQINRTWEFSPGFETFLIGSYRIPIPSSCMAGSSINLTYDKAQLDTVAVENLAYHSETITTHFINTQQNKIEISNLNYDGNINHVYIKLKTNAALRLADTIKVKINANICGIGAENDVQFIAKGNPHDPNEKLVNHAIICDSQPDRTDLSYYIRFQNDGNAPVDSVDVEDDLAPELDKATLTLGDVPDFPTVYAGSDTTANSFRIAFKKLNLPGLKQTNPHYAYDQTCYAFNYNVCTKANLATNILYNGAKVSFHDPATATILPPVYTTYALTLVTDTSCYLPIKSCTVPTTEQAGIINSLTITPNPFAEELLLFLELEEKTRLRIALRDLSGRLIGAITDSEYTSGAHEFNWSSGRIPPGLYLLDVYTERGRLTRKIIKM